MKNILKLSLVSLCASGAVLGTTQLAQANHDRSASKDSDKQLVISEPAGAGLSSSTETSFGGATIRTSNLIGEKVVDSAGHKCGKVADALIDLQSGRLAFLIIDTHGGRQVAVPGDQLRPQDNEVMLNINHERLMSAPTFSASNINDPSWASQVYSFYGESSPWQGGQVAMSSPSYQSYQSSPSYQSGTSYQSSGTTYQSGSTYQNSGYRNGSFFEASGAATGPGLVTGRDQDCQADCILHKYQAGKGSAWATDEHYWNNVPSDRLYAQYPSGGSFNNNSYSSYSYNAPSSSSSWSSYQSQPTASYGSSSSVINESAGASSSMHLYRSRDLIGMHVRASGGQDLGEIRDVVLDLNSGRIAYAVLVPTGGQFGGKYLAIPPSAFNRTGGDQHVLTLSMDANQLNNAPSFEANNWPQPQNQTFIGEVYNFYHVSPYWQSSGQGNWQNDNRRMHHHEGTGSDLNNNSQGYNNERSSQGYNNQNSSTSGTIQGSSTTDEQNLNNQSSQGSIQNQGSSSDQNQNLNNQNQNQNEPVKEPSGAEQKGAEHHDSAANLNSDQSAAGASSSASVSDSSDKSSSSSSGLQSSDEQLKKGAERQTDSIKEPAGAEPQSSATQSGTSGAQSSTELKSSQDQQGTATQESAGANTSSSKDQSSPSSTSTSTDQSATQSGQSSASPSTPDQTSTSTSTQTSTDQSSNQGLIEKVRSTLKSDSTLSPISSQVQVQDQSGKIALSGTVKSEAEKQQVVSKAEEIAGSGNVIDNLQVKSDSNP